MARPEYLPERGDFVRVVLDPRVGREQSGERPALVLTDRRFNELTGYAFVAPITATARGWPLEVPKPAGRRVQSVLLAARTTRIDSAARYASFMAKAQYGIVATVLD